MSRFGQTGKVVARVDREQDPYVHIDRIRQEVFEHGEWQDVTDKRLQILENAERDRLTATGAWKAVKANLDQETAQRAVDWTTWIVRGLLTAVCGGILGLALTGLMALVKK